MRLDNQALRRKLFLAEAYLRELQVAADIETNTELRQQYGTTLTGLELIATRLQMVANDIVALVEAAS